MCHTIENKKLFSRLPISLEAKCLTKSWLRTKHFIKPNTQNTYATLKLDNKTTKTKAHQEDILV